MWREREREREARVPGVVFRVPAMIPCQPCFLAASNTRLDLPPPMSAAASQYNSGFGRKTHLVAIPLHLAIVLRATRSPSKRHRAGPRTVATLILGVSLVGVTASPSFRYHSTLFHPFQSGQSWAVSGIKRKREKRRRTCSRVGQRSRRRTVRRPRRPRLPGDENVSIPQHSTPSARA